MVADDDLSKSADESLLDSDDSVSEHSEKNFERQFLLSSLEQSAKVFGKSSSKGKHKQSTKRTDEIPSRRRKQTKYGSSDTTFITIEQAVKGMDKSEGKNQPEFIHQSLNKSDNDLPKAKESMQQRRFTDDNGNLGKDPMPGVTKKSETSFRWPSCQPQCSAKRIPVGIAIILLLILWSFGAFNIAYHKLAFIMAYHSYNALYDFLLLLVTGYAMKVIFTEMEMEKVSAMRIIFEVRFLHKTYEIYIFL